MNIREDLRIGSDTQSEYLLMARKRLKELKCIGPQSYDILGTFAAPPHTVSFDMDGRLSPVVGFAHVRIRDLDYKLDPETVPAMRGEGIVPIVQDPLSALYRPRTEFLDEDWAQHFGIYTVTETITELMALTLFKFRKAVGQTDGDESFGAFVVRLDVYGIKTFPFKDLI